MIRVATIAREFGSGGAAIAAGVAESLGWRLLDRHILEEVCREAGLEKCIAERWDECVDSAWDRILRSLALGGAEGGPTTATATRPAPELVADFTRAVILRAADEGRCVIVGRGGQCILQNRQDVLHIFVYGPYRQRLERVRSRCPEAADSHALLERKDRERAAWIRRQFGCDWSNRHLYDVMISSAIGEGAVIASIVELIRASGPDV